jgi:hypothetical protein
MHPQVKILVRVYLNGTASRNANNRPPNSTPVAPRNSHLTKSQRKSHSSFTPAKVSYDFSSFASDFTSSNSLFDIIDVGYGKERADDKIRENFNLYISNPLCHAVFLACCTDNGFARMLSPYQYNREAYEKIVLVSAGYVEREIGELGFRDVQWDAVFKQQPAPVSPSIAQMRVREQKKAKERTRTAIGLEAEKEKERASNEVSAAEEVEGERQEITPQNSEAQVALKQGPNAMQRVEEGSKDAAQTMNRSINGAYQRHETVLGSKTRLGVRMMSSPVVTLAVPRADTTDNEDEREWEDDVD